MRTIGMHSLFAACPYCDDDSNSIDFDDDGRPHGFFLRCEECGLQYKAVAQLDIIPLVSESVKFAESVNDEEEK